MTKTPYVLLFITGLLFISNSCRKDHTEHPCARSKPVTADFIIAEQVHDTLIAVDTAYANWVVFKAIGDYDSVKWKIGYDNRTFTQSSFGLWFSDNDAGDLPVTMIAYSTPNKQCHPDDDGIDTLTKKVVLVPWNRFTKASSPILGNYRGYVVGREKDTFTVNVRFFYDPEYTGLGPTGVITINNFPKEYTKGIRKYINDGTEREIPNAGISVACGYRSFRINEDDIRSKSVEGIAFRRGLDSLIINYSVFDTTKPFPYPRLNETFIGIKH